jgi:hypothetical protein
MNRSSGCSIHSTMKSVRLLLGAVSGLLLAVGCFCGAG